MEARKKCGLPDAAVILAAAGLSGVLRGSVSEFAAK